ncbi:olfactory receptor 2AT4-like [Crocuta crocuta]
METRACNGSEESSTNFYRVGIPSLPKSFFLPIFFVFLLLYLLILLGNALVLVALVIELSLHKPMYFFLINLSALDILFTKTTVPKMLSLLLLGNCSLSFPVCFLQIYLFHSFSCSGAFILVVMAYDRYVAFCYAHILASVLCISSQEGRSKAFSTCSSHLLVVGTYYSSIAIVYVAYRADLPLDFHVMGNVVYAIFTPVLNPLIYTLRNKDVKAAITRMIADR